MKFEQPREKGKKEREKRVERKKKKGEKKRKQYKGYSPSSCFGVNSDLADTHHKPPSPQCEHVSAILGGDSTISSTKLL